MAWISQIQAAWLLERSTSIVHYADTWPIARALDRYRDCQHDIRHFNHGFSGILGTGPRNAAQAQVSGRRRFHLPVSVSLSIGILYVFVLMFIVGYLSYHRCACQVSVPHCGAKTFCSTTRPRRFTHRLSWPSAWHQQQYHVFASFLAPLQLACLEWISQLRYHHIPVPKAV